MGVRKAIIIGAGPAGLTAAYELLTRTDVEPVVYESTNYIGGISKTIDHKGNRLDIGPHRFFSKSPRVIRWWQNLLPLQGAWAPDDLLLNRKPPLLDEENGPDPEQTPRVMLSRRRMTRILFASKFYDYPVKIDLTTVKQLGLVRMMKIITSYMRSLASPINPEKSLEDFFVNRFGRELYATFFRDYTEKVWGVPCDELPPDWGSQRVKTLSIARTVLHALKRSLGMGDGWAGQQSTETSLIEKFLYPKYGAGQLWEECARQITQAGGQVHLGHTVKALHLNARRITGVDILDETTSTVKSETGDFVFSSMPVRDLIKGLGEAVPQKVRVVAEELVYRDMVIVGILLKRLRLRPNSRTSTSNHIVPDHWIYVQEPGVKVARFSILNNWSPYLVKNPNTVWLGLEYMCNEHDQLWDSSDESLRALAERELASIGVADPQDVLDHVVVRVPKAYPAYLGGYDRFETIRSFTDGIENLFLIGRNGMHRYNNQDHSMLSAMAAVENVIAGTTTKENIWSINTEDEYHEGA